MSTKTRIVDQQLGRIVEKQLRNWEIARSQRAAGPGGGGEQAVEHFVSISRPAGLPGEALAKRLGERIGWPVFDREILRAMADDDEFRERIYRKLDEHDESWLHEFVRSLGEERFIGREDYFHRLTQTVAALSRAGHAIFLGRATDMILPRELGLRIRLTATREYCVRRFAEENRLPYEAARRQVEEIEHERARFLRNHFHVEASDPKRHDLVINFETFGIEQSIELILCALRVRGIMPEASRVQSP